MSELRQQFDRLGKTLQDFLITAFDQGYHSLTIFTALQGAALRSLAVTIMDEEDIIAMFKKVVCDEGVSFIRKEIREIRKLAKEEKKDG